MLSYTFPQTFITNKIRAFDSIDPRACGGNILRLGSLQERFLSRHAGYLILLRTGALKQFYRDGNYSGPFDISICEQHHSWINNEEKFKRAFRQTACAYPFHRPEWKRKNIEKRNQRFLSMSDTEVMLISHDIHVPHGLWVCNKCRHPLISTLIGTEGDEQPTFTPFDSQKLMEVDYQETESSDGDDCNPSAPSYPPSYEEVISSGQPSQESVSSDSTVIESSQPMKNQEKNPNQRNVTNQKY